jgi:hypothetical protein
MSKRKDSEPNNSKCKINSKNAFYDNESDSDNSESSQDDKKLNYLTTNLIYERNLNVSNVILSEVTEH